MSSSYEATSEQLRHAYDAAVEERAERPVAPWKLDEREAFLELLVAEGRQSLLELGPGPGLHGAFFAARGMDVLCVDLSPAMVEYCRAQGLSAECQDVVSLQLPRRFDAAFAMNCFLHLPPEQLSTALGRVSSVLVAGGLFYLGQYGGFEHQGPFFDDVYTPKRYFSWLTDHQLVRAAEEYFSVVSFHAVDVASTDGAHFQALVLRTGDRP